MSLAAFLTVLVGLSRIYHDGKWECPRILDELDRTHELYFDRVSQIRMESWSRGGVALTGDAALCVSLVAGQGSALAMISAYVLAGELANAGGRHISRAALSSAGRASLAGNRSRRQKRTKTASDRHAI